MTNATIPDGHSGSRLAPGRFRLLVVDDNSLVRHGMAATLKGIDGVGQVETAQDGLVALDKIRRMQPHLVILDLDMPVMDGQEVLAKLSRGEEVTRCIVYSSMAPDSKQAQKALASGAVGFVQKAREGECKRMVERLLSVSPD